MITEPYFANGLAVWKFLGTPGLLWNSFWEPLYCYLQKEVKDITLLPLPEAFWHNFWSVTFNQVLSKLEKHTPSNPVYSSWDTYPLGASVVDCLLEGLLCLTCCLDPAFDTLVTLLICLELTVVRQSVLGSDWMKALNQFSRHRKSTRGQRVIALEGKEKKAHSFVQVCVKALLAVVLHWSASGSLEFLNQSNS